MRSWRCLRPALAFALLLASCGQGRITVTLLVDGETHTLVTSPGRSPADLLARAEVTLGENDRLLYLGSSLPLDQPLPSAADQTLAVRRAVTVTLVTPGGQQELQSSALTVGQALAEAGIDLGAADGLDPPSETPIYGPLTVTFQPARDLIVSVDGAEIPLRTSAGTVGSALAEAGLPLVGLDYSVPTDSEPLPGDGRIRVVRVSESIALNPKAIPFQTRNELTADLEIDQQKLLQGGEPGLAVTRIRTRSEDGAQVSQQNEGETVVRPPQDRIMGFGTKVVIRTAVVDGVTIEYWRALWLRSTAYIPCDQNGVCHYGTSMGTRVRRGEVAFVYPWYLLLAGERVYVPGYGFATVEDNNGANVNAFGQTYWIDLGYAQDDVIDWHTEYVTVYFLTPVPANIDQLYILP